MNAQQYLAEQIAEKCGLDFALAASLADRIAQTQRIRSITEDAHTTLRQDLDHESGIQKQRREVA